VRAVGHLVSSCCGIAGSGAVEQLVGRGDALGLFDQVGVDEEEVEVGLGERLLDADAVEAGSGGGAVGGRGRVVPEAGGAVAALGRPDAAGMLADVADVGGDGGADLGADALVGAEQRHVAVGGAAGDDLDQADVVEVAEALDDVAAEGVEVVERLGEEAVPEAGGLGEVGVAGLDEVGLVFAGGDDLAGEVVGELGDEDGVGELLEQDGREIEVAVEGDAVALEVAEDAQEREVGFGGGFVQPLHAVRPGAVVDDVGQVGVQREGSLRDRKVGFCGITRGMHMAASRYQFRCIFTLDVATAVMAAELASAVEDQARRMVLRCFGWGRGR
jgi:hypothetical protein